MKTQNTLSVEQKLLQIGEQMGYPFAINASGAYADENDVWNYKGLQVWNCDEDAQGYGVEIFVFPDEKFIKEDYDNNYALYNEVDEAEFWENRNDERGAGLPSSYVFFFENAK